MAVRQRKVPHVHATREEQRKRLVRGGEAGRVAVVCDDHRRGLSREEVGLRGRERRPHRGDRIRGARALARDAVEIALDEQNGVFPADCLFRAVEAIEELALREARRLRRIEVFRLIVSEGARAEAQDLAAPVADLDREAVAEAVVHAARLGVFLKQPGIEERLFLDTRGERRLQRIPRVEGRAEAVRARVLEREAAFFEERPGGLVPIEVRAEKRGRQRERLGRPRLFPAVHARAAPAHRERDAGEAREVGDGLGKLEALGLSHERDRVALGAASEAVIEALVGMHVKGRGLLAVERAQALPRAAGLLERRRGADQLDEVRRREDVVLDVVRDVVNGLRHPASRS